MQLHRTTPRLSLATLLLVLAAGAANAQAAAPVPGQLLHHAAEVFTKTHTVHFTLASQQVPPGLHLSGVAQGEGTAIWPDQMVFNGAIQSTPALAMSFVMVMCGRDPYVELGDGVFQKMQGAPNVGRLLFAPDTSFIANVLAGLEHASTPQAATLDQVATWHVTGLVPRKLVALLPGAAAASAAPLHADLWIGQRDMRLRQLVLSGAMFEGDSAQTTRTLRFSHFDESMTLTVPRGTIPCNAKP